MPKFQVRKNVQVHITIPVIIALANLLLKKIQFVEFINDWLDWNPEQDRFSPGMKAKVILLATFTDLRAPLIHVAEKFREMDVEYLFGEGVTQKDLNSFALGRALERLGEKNLVTMFEQLSAHFFREFKLRMRRLHADTTTISFYGEYDFDEAALSEAEREEVLRIVRGYNKDGKPQCKQVVVGQITNEDGIPVYSQVMDGNTSDVDWNKKACEYVNRLVKEGSEAILVADSKLVCAELITQMLTPWSYVPFVSRCPSNFEKKLESRAISQAYETGAWEEIGCLSGEKDAARYRVHESEQKVCGHKARVITVGSSALEGKAEDKLQKAQEALTKLISEVEKKRFACREDAQKEWERFEKQPQLQLFVCAHSIDEEVTEKRAPGRPSADTPKAVRRTVQYRLTVQITGEDPEEAEMLRRRESCFVLLSNVPAETLSTRGILETYKGQIVVERSFRAYKDASLASVIYLKNPDRVEALTMLLSVALLLRGVIQYLMRTGLAAYEAAYNALPRIGWGGKPLKSPTYTLLYESCKTNYFLKTGFDDYTLTFYNDFNEAQVVGLLGLMGYGLKELL